MFDHAYEEQDCDVGVYDVDYSVEDDGDGYDECASSDEDDDVGVDVDDNEVASGAADGGNNGV